LKLGSFAPVPHGIVVVMRHIAFSLSSNPDPAVHTVDSGKQPRKLTRPPAGGSDIQTRLRRAIGWR
jgi:hypothetical protein